MFSIIYFCQRFALQWCNYLQVVDELFKNALYSCGKKKVFCQIVQGEMFSRKIEIGRTTLPLNSQDFFFWIFAQMRNHTSKLTKIRSWLRLLTLLRLSADVLKGVKLNLLRRARLVLRSMVAISNVFWRNTSGPKRVYTSYKSLLFTFLCDKNLSGSP